MKPFPHNPPQAILERYLLGELPPDRMEELERLRDVDPAFRARLEDLRASNAGILELHPPEAAVRGIRMRRSPAPEARAARAARNREPGIFRFFRIPLPLPFPFRLAAPAFAMLTLGLSLFLPSSPFHVGAPGNPPVTLDPIPEGIRPGPDGIRLKGAEAGLAVFRKTRGGSELLAPQSIGRPGDTLQVFYHSRKAAYGVIFSVDGNGSITLHFPEAGGPAAALGAGDMLPLPHAFRLDKAPRLERFFLVTSPEQFSCGLILERAQRTFPPGGAFPDSLIGLDAGFRQFSYTIRKPGSSAGKASAQAEPRKRISP